MRHIRMHGLKPNGCLSSQSAVGLYFKFLIGYNGSGLKEAASPTKHNTMRNDKSKYEAQMFEPAQRFLLSPCYVSALAFRAWGSFKIHSFIFCAGIFSLCSQNLISL